MLYRITVKPYCPIITSKEEYCAKTLTINVIKLKVWLNNILNIHDAKTCLMTGVITADLDDEQLHQVNMNSLVKSVTKA